MWINKWKHSIILDDEDLGEEEREREREKKIITQTSSK